MRKNIVNALRKFFQVVRFPTILFYSSREEFEYEPKYLPMLYVNPVGRHSLYCFVYPSKATVKDSAGKYPAAPAGNFIRIFSQEIFFIFCRKFLSSWSKLKFTTTMSRIILHLNLPITRSLLMTCTGNFYFSIFLPGREICFLGLV